MGHRSLVGPALLILVPLAASVRVSAHGGHTLPIAYPDRTEYRALVVGQLVADDSIVLLGIELDLYWRDEPLD